MSKLTRRDRHGREIPVLPSKDIEFRSFFDTVEREGLLRACEDSEDERLQAWAEVRRDEQYKHYLDVTLARKCQVTLKSILSCYTEHQKTMALAAMANRMPAVAEDIAEDAQTRRMPCPKCFGQGEVTVEGSAPLTCENCWGTGELRQAGDAKAREQMLEAMEITGKKVPLVAQQFNMGDGFSVDSLIRQGQKVLEGR